MFVPSKATQEGQLLDPELSNHVAIPPKWKDYLYHVGSSFTVNSILQAGLIEGGRCTEEGRQTVFFRPLDPTGDETEEEYESQKSTLQEQVDNFSGRILLDHFGKSTR